MDYMNMFYSPEEFLESEEKQEEEMFFQEVYSGDEIWEEDLWEEEVDTKKQPEKQQIVRKEEREKQKKINKERRKEKSRKSLLFKIRSIIVQECDLLRDEANNIYFYEGGSYVLADKIRLAQFIKRSLPDYYLEQISDPGFYSKLLLDLMSDSQIRVIDRKKVRGDSKYKVAFQNGVYDCLTGEFLDFSPDYQIFSKLKVSFVLNPHIHMFPEFLEDISRGDSDIVDLIWEMIAYFLLTTNEGKCFFVMGTAPNSGKSLIAKVIEAMFSDTDVNRAPISAISGRFALASMSGKRINIAPECVNERISPEVVNNIKMLTGEDSVNVERKGEDSIREYMTCKLLVATNCATAFAVKDEAFWNRMRIVPFLHSVPQSAQVMDLFEKIERELNDIASYAVMQFAGRLIRNNYQFTTPEVAMRLLYQWRNNSVDILKGFLECNCEITHDQEDFIPVGELYEEYCAWLKQHYYYMEPLAIRDFSRKIRENITQCTEVRQKERVGDKFVRVLHGICWLKDCLNAE